MGDGTGERSHVRALDGLRGAAVLGVLAFHLAALDGGDRRGLLHGGWLGVDTFFTLSGFLITSLLLAEMAGTGGVDLRAFWRRRIRRLQPAALVAVTGIVATAVWWSAAGTGTSVRSQAFAALGAVSNWQALWSHHAYAAGTSPSGFEHFWSLAVEEQFYLVWPLVLAGVAVLGGRRRAVRGIAAAGVVASWALLSTTSLQQGYLRTDTRMGSILIGAALATVLPLHRRAGTSAGRRWAGVAVAGGLAATAVLWLTAGWPARAGLGLLLPAHALITAAVLAGVVLAPETRPARLLAARPLVSVGRVSYGVYLWHWPVFVLCTPERLGTGWARTTVVRLALVAGLTALSWRLVEHPVRRDLVLRRTRLALPVAVTLAVLVAGLAVHAVHPAPAWARADGRVLARSPGRAITVALPAQHPHRVLVVGDSIPTSLMAGDAGGETLQVGMGRLLDQLGDRGIEGFGGTITGCPVAEQVIVIDGRRWDHCMVTQRRVLPEAMATARPDLVVWYARQDAYPALLPDGRLDGTRRGLEERLARRVAWFAAGGARVAFVAPGPNRDGHDAYAPRGSARRSMALLDGAFHAVAARHPDQVVGVIRMAELLCGTGPGCPDRMPDGHLYRDTDGVHFSHEGALAAGAWLADRIAAIDLSRGAGPPGR